MKPTDRECAVIIKMSRDNRARLHAEARSLGITVQALAERKLLGIADAVPMPFGRVPQREELPMPAA